MAKNPTKKPRVLRRKNIMRKKGATAQAKQIATLSRQLTSITKENYERIRTSWQRMNLPIGAGAIASPYICPLPYAPCDPLGTSPVTAAQRWADNRQLAAQQFFTKRLVFGHSEAAANSNKMFHTGGKLRYTIYMNEPSYTKIGLFLIRPKKKQADQLVVDRTMKTLGAASAPGANSRLYDDVDFTTHDGAGGNNSTWYGAELNSKYWDVLYKREISLSQPKPFFVASNPQQQDAGNVSPANNAIVASGTIKLPAGGEIKAVGNLTQIGQSPTTALEQQYLDQRNEDGCFLVAVHNDVQADGQNVSMGFVVTDYYKTVV